MTTHTDPDTPVRWIPAADYVARHRARRYLHEILTSWLRAADYVARHRARRYLHEILTSWLRAGDWRLLAGAIACLLAALILAIATM